MFHEDRLKSETTRKCYRLNGLLIKMFPNAELCLDLKELTLKELKEKEESLIADISSGISSKMHNLESTKRELKRSLFNKDL